MTITKWISFAQPAAPAQDSPPPKPVPAPCTADGKQFGLENFGNTCYANSVLQALYFCRPFRELVIQHTDPYSSIQNVLSHFSPSHLPSSPVTAAARRRLDRKPAQDSSSPSAASHPPTPPVPSAPRTLFSALRALYIHISQNPADKGTIAPRAFIEKLRELNEAFRNTMHQDAHEFLNYLLNRIVEEIELEKKQRLASGDDLPRSMISSSTASHPPVMTASASSSSTQSSGATFIHRIFEGTLASETRCLTCENVSSRDESFLDLSIDIEQNSSVTACLRQFSASEMLCQKDKFFCDACCDLQEAERRMKIKHLPNVLALHLKRFKYQEDVQKYIKLTYRVAFPLELRLFNTVDDIPNPDRLYELFAIVVHIGNGPNHGHYVSIIKTMGTWFIFDDDTVDSIKESDIPKYFGDSNSGSAYVLYYQAVDVNLSALGFRTPSPEPVTQPVPQPEPRHQLHPSDSPVSTAQSIPMLPPGLTDDSTSPARVPDPLPRPATPPPLIPSPIEPPEKSPRKMPSQLWRAALGRPSTAGQGNSRSDDVLRPPPPIVDEFNTVTKPLSPINLSKEELKPLGGHPTPGPAPVPAPNGKEKDHDRSMMSWFRRRSFKSIKSRPSSDANTDVPPIPRDFFAAPASPARNQSTSSSSQSSKDSRHPLDSPSPSHPSPVPRVSPLPNGRLPPLPRTIHVSNHNTDSKHSLASTSSYATSISSPPDRRSQSRPLPAIPPSPRSHMAEPSPTSSSSTRKSLDHRLPRRLGSNFYPPTSPKSPSRPATSAGISSRTHSALSTVPSNHNLRTPSHSIVTSKLDSSDDPATERPRSAHASYSPVSQAPAVAFSPPPPVNDTKKRTIRKLSLSTPMLGFMKKSHS